MSTNYSAKFAYFLHLGIFCKVLQKQPFKKRKNAQNTYNMALFPSFLPIAGQKRTANSCNIHCQILKYYA